MGNSATKSSLTQEQEDIKYLGDRFPYGDDELYRLYRAYQAMHQAEQSVSFLSDLAIHCTVLSPREQDNRERLEALGEQQGMLMAVVEEKILPPDFGDRFKRVAFVKLECYSMESSKQEDEYSRISKLEKFFDGATSATRRGGRAALGTLFQCCVEDVDDPDDSSHLVHRDGSEFKAKASKVLDLAYRLSLAAAFLSADENMQNFIPPPNASQNEILKSLVRSMLEFQKRKKIRASEFGSLTETEEQEMEMGLVSKMDFLEWSEATAPLLASTLPTFMHNVFFPEKSYPPSRTAFVFPVIPSESAFFHDPASPMLFAFASMSSSLGGSWHRLYTSTSDGLSFNRLMNSLLGYSGPTLLIIQAINGGIFGAFTASSWKESKDFYGNSDCFLYQLLPTTAVYRPRGSGTSYMYCNSEARSRGYDQLAHGIGFGGDNLQPRLFIAESFEGNLALSNDMTFESGPLLPRSEDGMSKTTFEIDNLEVWGVGGDAVVAEALESRVRARAIKDANIKKARKVDKAAFLDDFRSGIIESKAFQHRQQVQGRAECDLEDRIHQQEGVYGPLKE